MMDWLWADILKQLKASWLSGCSCQPPGMNQPGRVSHLPTPLALATRAAETGRAPTALPHPPLGTAAELLLLPFLQGKSCEEMSKGLGKNRRHKTHGRGAHSDSSALCVPSQARCQVTPIQAPNAPGRLALQACGKQPATGIWPGSI